MVRLVLLKGLCAVLLIFAVSCGGGGGGGGGDGASSGGPPVTSASATGPYIVAELMSFPAGRAPAGFVGSGFNSIAAVWVLDPTNGSSIGDASVSVNGVILAYSAADEAYEAELTVAPGESVILQVNVRGATYTASGAQFTSYPTITAPLVGITWSSSDLNLTAWSGAAPTANSLYLLGVFDTGGQLMWPTGNVFKTLPTNTTFFMFNPDQLTVGSRLIFTGVSTTLAVPSAAPGSGMVIAGFNYVPITISNGPAVLLSSIAVAPPSQTIGKGGTLQLTAIGTYSDGSTRDLTPQVTWTSSDTAKATVSPAGLLTGVDFGHATVTATYGFASGSFAAIVFQPNPSPSPPLSQSVAYQIDYAHSGRAVFADPVTFPGGAAWSVTLNGNISYPLIVGDTVFVTTERTGANYGTWLYALNKRTGDVVWGPVTTGAANWSGHAYDNGKVFELDFFGLLRSFDAATGQAGWTTQLPNQAISTSPPTAVNGIVYVSSMRGNVFAVEESSGNLLWTATVSGVDHCSPAVSSDGVFVNSPCHVYKLDPSTGSVLWSYNSGCTGGGGTTPTYANGLLYVRETVPGSIFDAATGAITGNFTSTPIPALSTQTGFFLSAGTLTAVDLGSHNVLWTFTGDGTLVSAPIIINQTVVVGGSSGNVYALDAVTGSQIWSDYAGSPIAGPDEVMPLTLTGFGAGEGYLIVPAGDRLTAWHISGP